MSLPYAKITLSQVGIIHTPHKDLSDCPLNTRYCNFQSEIEIFPEYENCLTGIEEMTHLFIFYWLKKANRKVLACPARHDGILRGVFATRSPNRPNPIGVGVVPLLKRNGLSLTTGGLDCLSGTPLLDVKPYVASNDAFPQAVTPWDSL